MSPTPEIFKVARPWLDGLDEENDLQWTNSAKAVIIRSHWMGEGEMKNVVFFDLETQRSFDEVGGRHHIQRMGLSVAVTYSTASAEYRYYTEENVDELIEELKTADLVVGFNVLGFDYEVLRGYTDYPLKRLPTVDMLADIYRTLGFRLSLDTLASATLGLNKSADGLQAIRWWRQGDMEKLMAYCQNDVDVTRQLYEFGRQHKYVQYRDRNWRMKKVPVNW